MEGRLLEAAVDKLRALVAIGSGGSGGGGVPASWAIPQWYIDPANISGHASNLNNGTSRLTPLLTWGALVTRWESAGQVASPRFSVESGVVVTFMSSQPTGSDYIYFFPAVETAGGVIIEGDLTTAQRVSSGTFTAVTARERSTGVFWQATFSGTAPQVGWLVHDTAVDAWCWVRAVAGPVATLTEPLGPGMPSLSNLTVSETAIASGNSYVAYDTVKLNLVVAGYAPTDVGVGDKILALQNPTVQTEPGAGFDTCALGAGLAPPYLFQIRSQRLLTIQAADNFSQTGFCHQSFCRRGDRNDGAAGQYLRRVFIRV